MKILLDMNLSPEWISVLLESGWETVHWSNIGNPRAPDHEIMEWAKSNKSIVFTHDLDFGSILAATKAEYPSVIQIRTQDINPHHKNISDLVISALHQFHEHLQKGALITIDKKKSRARILPIND